MVLLAVYRSVLHPATQFVAQTALLTRPGRGMVEMSAEVDVNQRIRDHGHVRGNHERDQFSMEIIGIDHGGGGDVRGGHAPLHPGGPRQLGENLYVTRGGVVALIAVHIHEQPTVGGDSDQVLQAAPPEFRCPFVVRNAANDVDSRIECPVDEVQCPGRTVQSILGKRDQLDVDAVAPRLAQGDQRLHPTVLRLGYVHV